MVRVPSGTLFALAPAAINVSTSLDQGVVDKPTWLVF